MRLGFETLPGTHPVVPLFVRDTPKTTALVRHLLAHGVLATGLNFPVVPKGDETIRFQVSADHTAPTSTSFWMLRASRARDVGPGEVGVRSLARSGNVRRPRACVADVEIVREEAVELVAAFVGRSSGDPCVVIEVRRTDAGGAARSGIDRWRQIGQVNVAVGQIHEQRVSANEVRGLATEPEASRSAESLNDTIEF